MEKAAPLLYDERGSAHKRFGLYIPGQGIRRTVNTDNSSDLLRTRFSFGIEVEFLNRPPRECKSFIDEFKLSLDVHISLFSFALFIYVAFSIEYSVRLIRIRFSPICSQKYGIKLATQHLVPLSIAVCLSSVAIRNYGMSN